MIEQSPPYSVLGYGGPQFFTLGATTGMVVLPSTDGSGSGNSSQTNKKVVFIQDTRSNILPNETMSGTTLELAALTV